MRTFLVAILLFAASSANAQQVASAPKFVRENSPVIALTHVQPIDGTGAAPQADQTFPQLYLAGGVTTARTTGSIEPYTDLQVKARVEGGLLPGPDLYLTTPYLEGAPSAFLQLHPLKDAAEARAFVEYWHSVDFTSVKAYMDVKPNELRAGIEEAHKLGMKVTGHLCSVGYNEAAEMGIDNLEHGPYGAPDAENSRFLPKCRISKLRRFNIWKESESHRLRGNS